MALKESENNVDIIIRIGKVYEKQRDFDRAIKHL